MRVLPVLFSASLFGSALLSFSVQPILGKMLLPMVGGAPAGWIVAMAFFQLSLLAGYGLSWGLSRLNPFGHAAALFALYAAGLYFLPPVLPAIDVQSIAGKDIGLAFAVFKALAGTILLPFIALTATTSAMQRVFAATKHSTAHDPYYLFIASNAGSFVGLFAYPFLLEPFSGLQFQAGLWAGVYKAAMLLLAVSCFAAWRYRRTDAVSATQPQKVLSSHVTKSQIVLWLLLAFIPCSLSMGITTLITTDMAGVPLFWVIPLGLYLLTFILAFSQKEIRSLKKLSDWQLNVIGFLTMILLIGLGFSMNGSPLLFIVVGILMLEVFFAIAWYCHRRLAESRPSVDKLGLFYFIIALGGSLAGIMHAFVLPFVLHDVIEFHAVAFLSLLLHPEFRKPIVKKPHLEKYFYIAAAVSVVCGIVTFVLRDKEITDYYLPALILSGLGLLIICYKPRLLFIVAMMALIGGTMTHYSGHVIDMGRNFFGSYVVYEDKRNDVPVRLFTHGNTIHGMEVIDGAQAHNRYETSYYARINPVSDVLKITHAKSWGLIGLGSGQLACYKAGMVTDYYEIDANVEKIARKYFTYLNECPPRDVFIGDGRLMLKQEGRKYDVILLDAFTSDSIPMHLVTVEAIQSYRQHLNKGGVILFHVSNRYLDLVHPLAAIAGEEGLHAYGIHHIPDNKKYPLALPSLWVAIPEEGKAAGELVKKGWKQVRVIHRPWTDDRSDLLGAFKLHLE